MNDARGSVWRKCDFHIHTPLSALENNFGSDFDHYVQTLFKKAIEKRIGVVGITDYFTIDGYKKIKNEYLNDHEKLKSLFTEEEIKQINNILVLPNIEFRLNKIIQVVKKVGTEIKKESGRVNFHIIFSDELSPKKIEESFLHDIDFIYESEPNEKDKRKKLKLDNLIELGRRLKVEQGDIHGTDAQVGMTHAVVNDEQITELLTSNNDFKNKYLIAVPSDEDLSEIQWKSQDGLTRKILLSRCHAFLSSNAKTIEFGLGEIADNVDDFIKEFKSLKPCIWGSDAHNYDKMFEPDLERYCWIKADPTFEGMRQILFEPHDRVFIGCYPALGARIQASRNCYMESLSVAKVENYDGRKGTWFDSFNFQLGFELTAIIGNKGKGKSAIADILALLGNAHVERGDFSFLNDDKFCQRGYAEHFVGTLKWQDGSKNIKGLQQKVDLTDVERLKYLPQSYLEKLCNNEDGKFQEEINKVVFSRLDDSDKLGKKSFSELKEFKTKLINQKIDELKNGLAQLNRMITGLEAKTEPAYKQALDNKLIAKKQELKNHEIEKDKIKIVVNPEADTSMSQAQREKAERLRILNGEIAKLETSIANVTQRLSVSKVKFSELELIRNELVSEKQKFEEWKSGRLNQYAQFNLDINQMISMEINTEKVDALIADEKKLIDSTNISLSKVSIKTNGVDEESLVIQHALAMAQKEGIEKELEKPFKDWQEYQRLVREWDIKRKDIVGTIEFDGSISFFEGELNYLDKELLPEIKKNIESRNAIVRQIFIEKQEVQQVYNKMKEAISEILKEHSKEQNISIETAFKIDRLFYNKVFDYINRYGAFYQNGDEELRKLVLLYNFDEFDQIIAFITKLFDLDVRFKEGRKSDFYNYISSLDYVDPEYDLRLNGKSLSQLSPGEKGGLLLIFYLVLDKDNKPLIIDQPEDNLDNQSVAEILVPYIKSAKKKRQIIMVTHNPNLAIVADAEQIIYMNIDKENNYIVSCLTGGIENPTINNHIVDILEGKMKAFDNRRVKYRRKHRLM